MRISGPYENENGLAFFDECGPNYRAIVKRLMDRDPDFGHTEMEATDQDGNDVTAKVYATVEAITNERRA